MVTWCPASEFGVAERRRGGELGKRRRKLVRDWVREGDKAVVAGGGEWVGRYELKEGGVGAFGGVQVGP